MINMKNQLASLEVAAIIKELQFLIGGKIDKIFQPVSNELLLQLHVSNHGKQLLKIIAGKAIYLTKHKTNAEKPPGFCMYLRKYLTNSRIREVNQLDFERIVEIKLETKEKKYSLVFEIFGKGNILLLEDGIILSATDYKKWKDRTVKPKEKYIYPKQEYNFLKLKEVDLIRLFDNTEKESIVKAMALSLGLGGIYAEEICLLANVDKNIIPKKFKKIKELFDAIKKLRKLDIDANIVDNGKDIVPMKLLKYADKNHQGFETYSDAIDSVFSEVKKDAVKKVENKEIAKYERMVDSQNKNIRKLEKDEELNRKKADLIYSHYPLISEVLEELDKASKKLSMKEIKKKLKDHKLIKELNTKDKTVVVDIDE